MNNVTQYYISICRLGPVMQSLNFHELKEVDLFFNNKLAVTSEFFEKFKRNKEVFLMPALDEKCGVIDFTKYFKYGVDISTFGEHEENILLCTLNDYGCF